MAAKATEAQPTATVNGQAGPDLRAPPIRPRDVTFPRLVRTYAAVHGPTNRIPPKEVEEATQAALDVLWDAFELEHGRIRHAFFSAATGAAAVLTDDNELWIDTSLTSVPTPEIDDLLQRCQMLGTSAWRVLAGSDDYTVTKELVFNIVTYGLRVRDMAFYSDLVPDPSALAVAEEALTRAQAYSDQAAQRRAQRRYVTSMLGAATVLTLWMVALGWRGLQSGVGFLWGAFGAFDGGPIFLSAVAGGLGATVSVLSRCARDDFVLDPTTPRWLAVVLGAGRVAIGMVFGVVLYFLIAGELLPVELPEATPPAGSVPDADSGSTGPVSPLDRSSFGPGWYFVGALAFLAGFSERFAKDALGLTEQRLLSTTSAGLPPATEAATTERPPVAPAGTARDSSSTPQRSARGVVRRPLRPMRGSRRSKA